MEDFKVGDVVVRKSYGGDVYFKIVQVIKKLDGKTVYILKGTNLRILADAPENDLERPSISKIHENDEVFNKKINSMMRKILIQRRNEISGVRGIPQLKKNLEAPTLTSGRAGRVLHIDGDETYLNICLRGYKKLGIDAYGRNVPEAQHSEVVKDLIREYRPDILVLTGHDSINKGCQNFKSLDSYRNSRYFVEAVKNAREIEPSYDDLVIFAGACQSHYEAIIDAGANFASSPHRVLIHALDPVFICERIAYSNIAKFLSPQEILENTITGEKGIGGLQTRGKFREGSPKSPYA